MADCPEIQTEVMMLRSQNEQLRLDVAELEREISSLKFHLECANNEIHELLGDMYNER